ncbi:MAG: hypothetical protein U0325_31215 [Polyangiales bacterium]
MPETRSPPRCRPAAELTDRPLREANRRVARTVGHAGSGDDDGGKRRRNDALLRKRLGLGDDVPITENRGYTRDKHTPEGSVAQRDIKKGKEAHVFLPGLDLDEIARRVIADGTDAGAARGWQRIVLRFDHPVGERIEDGRPGVPCYYAEIKCRRLADGRWEYHLVPRVSPPKES